MRIFVVVLLFAAFPTFAVEPLSSGALIEKCSSSWEADVRLCQTWVHGFISGAFASRTAKIVTDGEPETFSDRAKRTRISRGRTVYGQNVDAGYCLPVETTLDEVVEKLNAHAEALEKMPEHANQLMLGLLRKHYPCP